MAKTKTRKATKARKVSRKPAGKASTSAAPPGPSFKTQFLDSLQREHATTMKVLNAFPVEQAEFRPHPKAKSARELAFNFVIEQMFLSLALQNKLDLRAGFPKPPSDFRAIVDQFSNDLRGLVDVIKKTPEKDFSTTVQFPTGPGKMGDVRKMDFAWFILSDQIHHRGQYSVYLRMAGGKVPSIYGPSADEPWM